MDLFGDEEYMVALNERDRWVPKYAIDFLNQKFSCGLELSAFCYTERNSDGQRAFLALKDGYRPCRYQQQAKYLCFWFYKQIRTSKSLFPCEVKLLSKARGGVYHAVVCSEDELRNTMERLFDRGDVQSCLREISRKCDLILS